MRWAAGVGGHGLRDAALLGQLGDGQRGPGGSASEVTSTAATLRPRATPASPSTWSAWKWVSTTSGTRSMSSRRRQSSTSAGSGPTSTTTALPGPARSTSASPWPTSHIAITQPSGGQPGSAAARARPARAARTRVSDTTRRRSGRDQHQQQAGHGEHASGRGSVPHSSAGTGRAAPRRATDDPPTHQPAADPQSPECRPGQPDQSPSEPEHGGRADGGRGQQIGDHGHQADLPRQRRHHRRACELCGSRHRHGLRRPAREPARARRATPAPRTRCRPSPAPRGRNRRGRQPGVDQHQARHGHPERPAAPSPPARAHADQRHRSHHGRTQHAGLRARQQHEPDDTHAAHGVHPRPRTPAARARISTNPSTSVRLVPDREQVGQPGDPEVVRQRGSRPWSSPTTKAGTSGLRSAARPDGTAREATPSLRLGPPHRRGLDRTPTREAEARPRVVPVTRPESRGEAYPLPQPHLPPVGRRHHQHRQAQFVGRRARAIRITRPAPPPDRRTARDGPGVPRHHQLDLDGGPGRRQRRHRIVGDPMHPDLRREPTATATIATASCRDPTTASARPRAAPAMAGRVSPTSPSVPPSAAAERPRPLPASREPDQGAAHAAAPTNGIRRSGTEAAVPTSLDQPAAPQPALLTPSRRG